MVNVDKLRGKIVEKRMTIGQLAPMVGIDKSTFYRKLNEDGKTFTIKEVELIVKKLKLTKDEAIEIFFNQGVA